jgi:radical SAM protein with 4Fe4S-binding SPASM domain
MELQIETTSTCNAACSFCVYPAAERWGGLMDMDLFCKIVDEAAGIPRIDKYILNGLGEPLLDSKLEDRIWYIRQRVPKDMIQLYTNGVYLSPVRFEKLKKAGLTGLVVSLNAVNQEQHERIMGLKGKFDQVCSNIERVIRDPGDVYFRVRAVSNGDHFTSRDAVRFIQRWGDCGYGGHGECITEGNWAGDNRSVRSWKPNEMCVRAVNSIYVMYDGRISTCCFDPTGRQVFGDLSRESLKDVYKRDPYLSFRVAHSENRADEYEICKNCTRI